MLSLPHLSSLLFLDVPPRMKPYLKVTLGYMAFGLAWSFFSDRLLQGIADNIGALTFLQTLILDPETIDAVAFREIRTPR